MPNKTHKEKNKYAFYVKYVILALTIFTFFAYIFRNAPMETVARVGNYIQVITLIIFTITGLITVQSFKHQNDDRKRMIGLQHANISQAKIGDIDKMFMSNPLLDRLYFQMYSHDPNIQKILIMTKQRGPIMETPELLKAEHQAANLIFQKISDIHACEQFDEFDDDCIQWLNIFRGWMKSPILISHWQYLKYEQSPIVRNFVDKYLIEKNKFIH